MTIVWFRRDLRLSDHTALAHAFALNEPVLPIFIFSDELIREEGMGAPITRFFIDSVSSFKENIAFLGGCLWIRRGDFQKQLTEIVHQTHAKRIFFNEDYEPAAQNRDAQIKQHFEELGVEVKSFKDHVLFAKSEILSQSGNPYKVFTPYSKVWWQKIQQIPTPFAKPTKASFWYLNADLPQYPTPTCADFGLDDSKYQLLVRGGEKAAREAVRMFEPKVDNYPQHRDIPAFEGTSLLSAHLRAGTVSIRAVVKHFLHLSQNTPSEAIKSGCAKFINELCWRDFYAQILYHYPHVIDNNFLPTYERVPWQAPDANFEAWKNGKTGYPIVDAAMRQLLKHGWMHNRLRMITASFLCKHLLIHWRHGEAFFAQHLVDYDLASNNGGWQWSASTGTDAQPYFRVFNPTEQSKKFDAEGSFIRRFCPELANVPLKFLHQPAEMPPLLQEASGCIIGKDYPFPIVEHKWARNRAIEAFKNPNAP